VKRAQASIFVALILASATLASAASAPEAGPSGGALVATPLPGYLPDPYEGSGRVEEDGTWSFATGGVSLRLTPIDGEARWAWIRERAGARVDPFSGRPDEEPRYLTFVLEVRNDSAGVVSFNPDRIWLSAGGTEIYHPIDLATMESAYRMHDREMPPTYRAGGSALLHGDTLLRPGDRREGMLVFQRFRKPVNAFLLEIPMTTGSGDVLDFTAAWLEHGRMLRKEAKERKRRDKRARKGDDR